MSNITRESGTQQYEHIAAIAHGAHPDYRLEFDAAVKNVAESRKIRQGSIVSIDSTGEYIIGCPAGENFCFPVPCVSLKNIYDPDVMTGRSTGNALTDQWCPVGGKITAIPCTGGYEIETTEFDASATYTPGMGLVPATGETVGLITAATSNPGAGVPYVGFVSRAPYAPQVSYMHKRISFFTNFIPATVGASAAAAE